MIGVWREQKSQLYSKSLWPVNLCFAILIMGLFLSGSSLSGGVSQPVNQVPPTHPGTAADNSNIQNRLTQIPLNFIPNVGQTDLTVRYQVDALGGRLFFTPGGVTLALPTFNNTQPAPLPEQDSLLSSPTAPISTPSFSQLHLRFEGANPNPDMTASEKLPGVVNYFIGDDPAQWHTNISTHKGIIYQELYPGIDLQYDGNEGLLKGTYVVTPGADPSLIRWRYQGAKSVWVDKATGDLRIQIETTQKNHEVTTLIEYAPVAWQNIGGQKIPISVAYNLAVDGSVGFKLGPHDVNYPLILDPILDYSTYLGGSGSDLGGAITIDQDGNVYIIGHTSSLDFPLSPNPLDNTCDDDGNFPCADDIFVTKLASDGRTVIYSTYLGGSDNDIGYGIAVDQAGNAYITGYTSSNNYPTVNPLQASCNDDTLPCYDAFFTKLNPTGTMLIYSTYFGGQGDDYGYGIAVDDAGQAYITGQTSSTDFPTFNPFQDNLAGEADAFVAKLTAQGTMLLYSTYLGGESDGDFGFAGAIGTDVAIDSTGHAYIIGATYASDFPTVNPVQAVYGGDADAFVTKLNPDGNALVYSTYLGGNNNECSFGKCSIVVDSLGQAYVTGVTDSKNFPTANALQPTYGGGFSDVFVAKLTADGGDFIYSTFLGGNDHDGGGDIAIDNVGQAYITGFTESTNFPLVKALQATYGGRSDYCAILGDVFVSQLAADGSSLL